MINVIIDNYIKVSNLPKNLFTQWRDRLQYPNPDYENAKKYNRYVGRGIPRTLRSWDYQDGQLCLPRGVLMDFLASLGSHGLQFNIIDNRATAPIVPPPPLITLRGYQEDLLRHALVYPGPGFMIQSAPGSGKTICGLEMARREARRTLWITHKKELAEQTLFAASDQSDVPVLGLPRSQIGFIGSGKFSIGDFLTIALVQTLQRKTDMLKKLRYEFGTVVIDEVHHAPASTWKQAIYAFAPQITLGLTATSYRSDGLSQMLFDCVGPVVARSDKQKLIDAGILILPSRKVLYTGLSYQARTFQEIVSLMIADARRNNILLQVMSDIYNADPRNVILFFSGRVVHVDAITDMCYNLGMAPVKLVGKLSKLERSLAYERLRNTNPRLLTATYRLLNEGFDYPPITHVIIGTPFRDPIVYEQVVGRAQRVSSSTGKTFAEIIDPYDNNAMLEKQSRERRAISLGLGMDVGVYGG